MKKNFKITHYNSKNKSAENILFNINKKNKIKPFILNKTNFFNIQNKSIESPLSGYEKEMIKSFTSIKNKIKSKILEHKLYISNVMNKYNNNTFNKKSIKFKSNSCQSSNKKIKKIFFNISDNRINKCEDANIESNFKNKIIDKNKENTIDDKQNTITTNITNSNNENKKFRFPKYSLDINFVSNEFYPKLKDIKFNKYIINSNEFQSENILNELILIIENYKIFNAKINTLNFYNIFNNLSIKIQKQFNIYIEEICSLSIEISYLILNKKYIFLKDFTGKKPVSLDKYSQTKIYNESTWLSTNLNLLTTLILQLKDIKILYEELYFKYSENMLLNDKNFNYLLNSLKKLRFNLHYIINFLDNYKENDEKFNEIIHKINNTNYKLKFNKSDDLLKEKINEIYKENFKKKRIKDLLSKPDKNDYKLLKKKSFSIKSILENKHLKKLFKYLNEESKNKIISLNSDFINK